MSTTGMDRPVTSPCGAAAAKKVSGIQTRSATKERAHIGAMVSAAASNSRDRDGNPEYQAGYDTRRQLTNSGLCLALHPGPGMSATADLEVVEVSGHPN